MMHFHALLKYIAQFCIYCFYCEIRPIKIYKCRPCNANYLGGVRCLTWISSAVFYMASRLHVQKLRKIEKCEEKNG
jgi:hypothetical protein